MEPNIDFEEASKLWRKNKISLGKGYFKYKCQIDGCDECLYLYVTESKYFDKFATDFDIKNKNHPNKYIYCEDHLLCSSSITISKSS
jgi:hypothetical protein